MKDLDVVAAATTLRATSTPHLIATVVRVRGSSYRRPGAHLVATEHGRVAGSISGGCLEGSLLRRGWWRTANGPALVEFDSSDPDSADAVLGCGGVVEVLLERGGGARDPLAFAARTIARGARGAIATVFASTRPGEPIGRRWFDDEADLPAALIAPCERAIATGKASLEHVDRFTVLVEPVVPPLELFVFGAGLDAAPIVDAATRLGWHANVWSGAPRFEHAARFPTARLLAPELDVVRAELDRADRAAAIVMSHDLRRDRDALAMLAGSRARYIGVLGPRHRTATLATRELLDDPRIHAPVGLDLGAETPDEIAVAVIAEVLAAMRGTTSASLRRGPVAELRA